MYVLYKCDFCDRTGSEDKIRGHEAECEFDINNKACSTCKFYSWHYDHCGGWHPTCSSQLKTNVVGSVELVNTIINCERWEHEQESL